MYGVERQVIVEGTVRELSQAESEPYYRSRARLSQIGAWASRQSTVIASRAVLDNRVAELERRWPEPGQVPMPDFWGGYLLEPDAVEFWQAGSSGCMTGCATGGPVTAGRSIACPPDEAPSVRKDGCQLRPHHLAAVMRVLLSAA